MADDKDDIIKRVEAEIEALISLIKGNPALAVVLGSRIAELLQTPGVRADLASQFDQLMSESKVKSLVNLGDNSGLNGTPLNQKQREMAANVGRAFYEYKELKEAVVVAEREFDESNKIIEEKRKAYREAYGTPQQPEAERAVIDSLHDGLVKAAKVRNMTKARDEKRVDLESKMEIAAKDPVLNKHLEELRKELDDLIKSSKKSLGELDGVIIKQIEHFIIEKSILDQNLGKSMDEKKKLIDEKVKEGLPEEQQEEIAKYVKDFETFNLSSKKEVLDKFLEALVEAQKDKYIIKDKEAAKPLYADKILPKKSAESMADRVKASREDNDLTPRQR